MEGGRARDPGNCRPLLFSCIAVSDERRKSICTCKRQLGMGCREMDSLRFRSLQMGSWRCFGEPCCAALLRRARR